MAREKMRGLNLFFGMQWTTNNTLLLCARLVMLHGRVRRGALQIAAARAVLVMVVELVPLCTAFSAGGIPAHVLDMVHALDETLHILHALLGQGFFNTGAQDETLGRV